VIAAALLLLQAATLVPAPRAPAPPADSLPRVTLAEAIRRATSLDPGYVAAAGFRSNSAWVRRQAVLNFLVPSITSQLDASWFSQEFFNVGIGRPASKQVTARVNGLYEALSVRKFAELTRSAAELEATTASEADQRIRTAVEVERDFYDVLVSRELLRVAEARRARAAEGLVIARARVLSGAAVQSDSLQLLVELSNAQLEELRQRIALRVARLQLGRRIGLDGPVEAAPLGGTFGRPLPLSLDDALRQALDGGPQYAAARAAERAAGASVTARKGDYLPVLNLVGQHQRFDDSFFPSGRVIWSGGLQVQWPLWNGAQREVAIQQARTTRDIAAAARADLERGARRDVTAAYEGYLAAVEAERLADVVLAAAQETYRVQDLRYRSGATTILDFLVAQAALAEAEAQVVQTRYAERLALAGLEVLLGRRLFAEDWGTE